MEDNAAALPAAALDEVLDAVRGLDGRTLGNSVALVAEVGKLLEARQRNGDGMLNHVGGVGRGDGGCELVDGLDGRVGPARARESRASSKLHEEVVAGLVIVNVGVVGRAGQRRQIVVSVKDALLICVVLKDAHGVARVLVLALSIVEKGCHLSRVAAAGSQHSPVLQARRRVHDGMRAKRVVGAAAVGASVPWRAGSGCCGSRLKGAARGKRASREGYLADVKVAGLGALAAVTDAEMHGCSVCMCVSFERDAI